MVIYFLWGKIEFRDIKLWAKHLQDEQLQIQSTCLNNVASTISTSFSR